MVRAFLFLLLTFNPVRVVLGGEGRRLNYPVTAALNYLIDLVADSGTQRKALFGAIPDQVLGEEVGSLLNQGLVQKTRAWRRK